jgi:RNA polymerase sigma factor (TIGR02999 family)
MQQAELTTLMDAAAAGDGMAEQKIYELVYDQLKHLARANLRRVSGPAITINASTLVQEAYLKVQGADWKALNGSAHFYNLVSRAMRQILLDIAKQRATEKHGVGLNRTELNSQLEQAALPLDDIIAIDAALTKLETCDAELAEVVRWHFFAGLSFLEIAEMRGVNERTVRRHWDTARMFLAHAM